MIKLFLFLFLILNCNSSKELTKFDEKLDLHIQKEYIKDALDIPEYQKKYILDTFDKTESFCNDCALANKSLWERVTELEAENKLLDSQAKKYRTIRNTLIALIITLSIYFFRNQIWSIIRILFKI